MNAARSEVVMLSALDLGHPGGVQRNFEMLRAGLESTGMRVRVLNRPFLPSDRWRRSTFRRLWRRVGPSGEEAWRIRTSVRRLARDLERLDRDAPCLACDAWAMMAAARAGLRSAFRTPTPSLATEESIENGYLDERSRSARALRVDETAALTRIDRVIALSERGREVFAGYGVPASRLRVIPNAVDVGPPPVARPPGAGRSIRLLWVGHIRPVKGLDVLVEAVAGLPEAIRRRLRVAVVGGGAQEDNPGFREARDGLVGADVRAEFLGVQASESVRREMGEADFLVSSSRRENFPNAILEAMAAGLPVASTDVGAVPEMLGPASAGLVVPPDDPGALGDAVCRLVNEEPLRRAAGAENRRLAEERFSVERLVASYREVIAELRDAGQPGDAAPNPAPPSSCGP